MKKILNRPENLVYEMCKGIELAHPELQFIEKFKIIKKRAINDQKVTLISGGGSGHEPAHAGYVGRGMLDAAVCGDVFASPSQIQVYQSILETTSEKGTLLIIKNYSGDIMNFRNAIHLANEDGLKVDYIKVDDDIAVQDSLYTVGHRGVAGTVMVHKITGALAEMGKELHEVKAIAEKAANNVKSIGFAFSSCTVPAKGAPTFEISDDEMEYGVGIHGEPGIKREKIISADELSERMVTALLTALEMEKGEIALMINGFGSTPLQELYLLNHSVYKKLHEKGIQVHRIFVGNFMTSIDMLGASVSIMKLDEELKSLLNSPCETPGLTVRGPQETTSYQPLSFMYQDGSSTNVSFEIETDISNALIKDNQLTLGNLEYMIDAMSACIIKNEVPFCELDSHAGDGDFGMSVAKGFKQLKREWNDLIKESKSIGDFLEACSLIIMEHCGGASGPIWGSAFRGAGKQAGAATEIDLNQFVEIMQASAKAIQKTGERSFGRGAVVGDKTLIDALVPAITSLKQSAKDGISIKSALELSAKAAVQGADATKGIVARMGRAGTVGDRSIGHPDAGAHALGVIFTEISNKMY
ncbi:MAG: dihydroxyacetone kinase subunit DhaK [Clostridia bacterium]|nr:dihydroxyacetone kinase subunit DhaK [Clostridia bacterium]